MLAMSNHIYCAHDRQGTYRLLPVTLNIMCEYEIAINNAICTATKKQEWQHTTTVKFKAEISFHAPNNIFSKGT